MMTPWRGLGALPKEIWILFTTTLINRAGTMALPFLALYLTGSIGLSAGHAGFIITVYGLGALITSPLAGRLCDHIGALRIMQTSLLLTGVALLLFPLAKGFAAIIALTFIWAVVSEAFRPASMTAIVDVSAPTERKQAFAVYRLAANLGMSIGPAAGGFLATISFPALFLVDALTALLAAMTLIRWRWPDKRMTAAATEEAPDISSPGRLIVSPAFLWFLAAMIPVNMVFFQHQSSMPLFLVRELHFAESDYGLLFMLNTALIVLTEVPLNSAMAHWPHRQTLALGSILCGIGFGALMFASSFFTVALTVVIWTFAEMILHPAAAACAADLADPARRGQFMGLYQMTFSLAFAIGPWLGAYTLEQFGARMLWSATLICGALSAAMMIRVSTPNTAPKKAGAHNH
jgi:predicted MFS family arabinose efflux permease